MPATKLKAQELAMLRAEIEMLMSERQRLLKTTGAAAFFVANLDYSVLPDEACEAARMLSNTLNSMPEETLREALETVEQEL
ncbi:MAG: hypothetical protein OEX82_06880, partial [Nitrosomonas sp.]|nr:hypothetical protein [Nitrosomonas sp.]